MKVFPKERLNAVIVYSSFAFVGLNVADAWFTRQLIGMGFREANPIVTTYASNLVIKGLLALVIVWLLVRFGKARLLLILNWCMLAIVLCNGVRLLW